EETSGRRIGSWPPAHLQDPSRVTSKPEVIAYGGVGRSSALFTKHHDPWTMLQIDRKTIYAYVQRGLIPNVRIESNVRFPKRQVMRWLEERSFHSRLVHGKGAKRQ